MADIKPGCGLEREYLYKKIPLQSPFTLNIVTSTFCNFHCNYCVHSLSDEKKKELGLIPQLMEWEIFEEIAEQIAEFSVMPKSVFLYGVGEPLCNPELEKMVGYLKNKYPQIPVSFISNGALLDEKRSLSLIDAGLDILRISIQGLSDENYKKTCRANILFDEMIQKIKFFYEHKKQCKLYVKIIDTALKIGEEEKFYQLFGDISDRMFVEKCMPIFEGVKYSEEIKQRVIKDRYGNEHPPRIVCPMTFFTLSVMPDGEVRPCDNLKCACKLGNIQESSLYHIWNSDILRNFWKMQLENRRVENRVCRECVAPDDVSHKEDELDDYRLELRKRL